AVTVVVASFGVYVLATLGTVRQILRVVPQAESYSYGIAPFGRWAANVSSTYSLHLPGTAWRWIVIGAAAATGILLRTWLRRRLAIAQEATEDQRDLDYFVAGSAIYVGTFALAQNFDYRLVFLLLTIPQLFRWTRTGRATALIALVLVQATLW